MTVCTRTVREVMLDGATRAVLSRYPAWFRRRLRDEVSLIIVGRIMDEFQGRSLGWHISRCGSR